MRRSKKVYAYVNSCPHIGVTLNWLPEQFLDSEGELIQCSTHGALFLIETGECISGPCNGQALTSLQVDERNNSIYLIDSL